MRLGSASNFKAASSHCKNFKTMERQCRRPNRSASRSYATRILERLEPFPVWDNWYSSPQSSVCCILLSK